MLFIAHADSHWQHLHLKLSSPVCFLACGGQGTWHGHCNSLSTEYYHQELISKNTSKCWWMELKSPLSGAQRKGEPGRIRDSWWSFIERERSGMGLASLGLYSRLYLARRIEEGHAEKRCMRKEKCEVGKEQMYLFYRTSGNKMRSEHYQPTEEPKL